MKLKYLFMAVWLAVAIVFTPTQAAEVSDFKRASQGDSAFTSLWRRDLRPTDALRTAAARYERFGPYTYSKAQDLAASIKKNFPKAVVEVRRDNDLGWYVHVYLP